MSTDDLDLGDEREFAWLLQREDTLLKSLLEVWRAVPTDTGSAAWRAFAHVLNGAGFLLCAAAFTALFLLGILLVIQGPVALFILVEPLIAAWVWWIGIGVAGFGVLLTLGTEVQQWLSRSSDEPLGSADGSTEPSADPAGSARLAWRPDDSLNTSHASSRGFTFAVYITMLGWLLEAAIVLLGEPYFAGSTRDLAPWLFYFGQLTIDTVLLGIPGTLIDPLSDIHPTHWVGRCLTVLVQLAVAAGGLTMLGSILLSTFRPRELFNGTVRQLADHLSNVDISDDDQLTIHRVAVVRPLDEGEVLSLSKAQFYARIGRDDSSAASGS